MSSAAIVHSSSSSHNIMTTAGSYLTSPSVSSGNAFTFSTMSRLSEPSHSFSADRRSPLERSGSTGSARRSPLERSGSTGSAASEGSHASVHSLERTSSAGSNISQHRLSMEQHTSGSGESYPIFSPHKTSIDTREPLVGQAGPGTDLGRVPSYTPESTGAMVSPGISSGYRLSQDSNDLNTSVQSGGSLISTDVSHSTPCTTSSVTSSASDTSVTSTFTTNKAISSPPRTYEYTHKKFAHRPMTKKERILGGKVPGSGLGSSVSSQSSSSSVAPQVPGSTSSVFPTRTLEFPLKRIAEDPSSPERHTKKARILGVQRPKNVVSSILKEYSFYHRHQRHINQDYLVHMPKGNREKKAKRRTIVGMPMKRKRRAPRDAMYMYPTRTGLRSASKPDEKESTENKDASEAAGSGTSEQQKVVTDVATGLATAEKGEKAPIKSGN